ncbi:MAG: hypothetical protein AAGI46_02765 [Planctomycetota bacterium]
MDDDAFDVLLTSDLALEVRETFEEMIGFGATPVAATQETVSRFGELLSDDEHGPLVLVVLAVLQLRHGMIFSSIRDAAVTAIDTGSAMRLASGEGRGEVHLALDELRQVLEEIDVEDDEDDDED